MKYYKFSGGYFALIMANTLGEAVDYYIDGVADFDEKETMATEIDIEEVAGFASQPSLSVEDLREVLDIALNGTEPEVLLVDASLI